MAVLKSASDIAAWIEERKKRFPTRKRAEEAVVRKKKLREAGKLGKEFGKKDVNNVNAAEDKTRIPFNEAAKAKLRAEKLRKQYEKAPKRIAEFEAQRSPVHVAVQTGPIRALKADEKATTISSISEVASDASTHISDGFCNETTILENAGNRESLSARLIAAQERSPVKVSVHHKRKELIFDGLGSSISVSQAMAPVFYPGVSSALLYQPLDHLAGDSTNAVPTAINDPTKFESDRDTSFSAASSSDTSGTDMEDTSSSGSSSDDDGPAETSSRDTRPILVPAPKSTKPKSICKVFLAKGRCTRGDGCHYRHQLPERGSGKLRAAKKNKVKSVRDTIRPQVERVSLYQRVSRSRLVAHEECANLRPDAYPTTRER